MQVCVGENKPLYQNSQLESMRFSPKQIYQVKKYNMLPMKQRAMFALDWNPGYLNKNPTQVQ